MVMTVGCVTKVSDGMIERILKQTYHSRLAPARRYISKIKVPMHYLAIQMMLLSDGSLWTVDWTTGMVHWTGMTFAPSRHYYACALVISPFTSWGLMIVFHLLESNLLVIEMTKVLLHYFVDSPLSSCSSNKSPIKISAKSSRFR